MKHLLLFFCLLLALKTTYAQDTLYYDENEYLVPTAEGAHTKKITIKENLKDSTETVLEFYISGAKKSETYYSNYANRTKNKHNKQWYENGQINIIANYTNNKLNGEVLTYWEDGTPKREDIYDNNVLIKGQCWDKDGNEIPHFDYRKGARPNFNVNEFVVKNGTYPVLAKREKIEGRVMVMFVVEKNGKISNVEIEQSVHPLLDAEAIRIIKSMPDWKPATYDNNPIKAHFRYPVNFTLTK